MAGITKFTPRPAGLAAALAAPPMQQALARKMRRARAYAITIAPVLTGRYKYGAVQFNRHTDPTGVLRHRARRRFASLPDGQRGGFHIESGVRNGVAYARLINVTPYAVYLEFGTRYMRKQRILGRAADALRFL